ncbi:MAG: ParA family protein [Sulfolobaceae archaeon]|nr:ParA family protein [Sulfolobaceae archaeon]
MPFKLSVIGFKGGSGKSLITYFIAKELSQTLKILLIDKTYSASISSLFKISDSIFSGINYEKTLGNLTVINASYSSDHFSEDKLMEVYRKYGNEYDVILLDNPSYPSDPYLIKEIEVYYKIFKQYTYNILLVLSEEEIDYSIPLQYLPKLEKYLKDLISAQLKIELPETLKPVIVRAIALNRYQRETIPSWLEENFPGLPKFKISSLNVLSIDKILEIPTPPELKSLAKYIEGLVYEHIY